MQKKYIFGGKKWWALSKIEEKTLMQRSKNLSKFWAELKTKKHKAPWHRVKLLETEARGYYSQPEIQYGQSSSSLVSAPDLGLGFTVATVLFSVFQMLLWPVLRAGLCTQGFLLHALLSEVPARTLGPQRALWLVTSGSASTVLPSSFAVAPHRADPWPLHPCAWSLGMRVQACLDADRYLSRAGECFLSSGSWPLLRMMRTPKPLMAACLPLRCRRFSPDTTDLCLYPELRGFLTLQQKQRGFCFSSFLRIN